MKELTVTQTISVPLQDALECPSAWSTSATSRCRNSASLQWLVGPGAGPLKVGNSCRATATDVAPSALISKHVVAHHDIQNHTYMYLLCVIHNVYEVIINTSTITTIIYNHLHLSSIVRVRKWRNHAAMNPKEPLHLLQHWYSYFACPGSDAAMICYEDTNLWRSSIATTWLSKLKPLCLDNPHPGHLAPREDA